MTSSSPVSQCRGRRGEGRTNGSAAVREWRRPEAEKRARRRRFGDSRVDSVHGEDEDDETKKMDGFDLLPGSSSGDTTAAGAASPRRPPEREREREQVGGVSAEREGG